MKTYYKLFIPIALLSTSTMQAQRHNREYTPSPVKGKAWNAPGNINPFIPGYFADPTIRKFGDTYYIYATTDMAQLRSGQARTLSTGRIS